ncbi:hypothetical protein LINPERHAP2_LOCUS16046 [Linum perenne]
MCGNEGGLPSYSLPPPPSSPTSSTSYAIHRRRLCRLPRLRLRLLPLLQPNYLGSQACHLSLSAFSTQLLRLAGSCQSQGIEGWDFGFRAGFDYGMWVLDYGACESGAHQIVGFELLWIVYFIYHWSFGHLGSFGISYLCFPPTD